MRETTAATHYLLPHERWLVERSLRRERATPRTDAVDAQGEQSAEIHRLDTAFYVDFYVGWILGVAGTLVALIIVLGFRIVTVALDIALCLMGAGFASIVLACVRQIQLMTSRNSSRSQRRHSATGL
jgi:hypothetical protein